MGKGGPLVPAAYYFLADAGRSATRRSETDSSSSWKCGFRNATARYAPGFPWNFGNLDCGFAQRQFRLCRLRSIVIRADVVHDPLIEEALAILAAHEAANLVAHHRLQIVSEA